MKKSAAITVIAILTAAAVALGALYVTNNESKTKEIGSLTADIETLTADASAKAEQIETLTADAAAKAGEIETLTADAAAKAKQIETLTADAAAKAGEIETLTADADAKAGEIETLKADAAAKAEQIETLKADAAAKAEQIEAGLAKIADQEKQISEQADAIAEKDGKIAELEAASAELQGMVDSLTAEIREKDAAIKALEADKENPPAEAPGTAEIPKNAPAETEAAPAEETGERIVYSEGGISITLPATVKYEVKEEAETDGRKLYADSTLGILQKHVFIAWRIDVGMDVSTLGDAMADLLLENLKGEIEKAEEVRDPRFEETTILGNRALDFEFLMNVEGQFAPAYGTVMFRGRNVYVFFYASLEQSAEEVKAEMLRSIGTITQTADVEKNPAGQQAPEEEKGTGAEDLPEKQDEDRALRFGMSREEIRDVLGPWDEEANISDGYDVVRYRNQSFRGFDSTLAVVTTDRGLHMWLYGIMGSTEAFTELEKAFSEEYTAYDGGTGEIIEIFGAMGMPATDAQLKAAELMGVLNYRMWKADAQTKVILMTVKAAGQTVTVLGYAQAAD